MNNFAIKQKKTQLFLLYGKKIPAEGSRLKDFRLVMKDIIHIFKFYLIQPLESENTINLTNYSIEVMIIIF